MENYLYTQNREFSWLRFNQRVLEEAADPTLPPLERLKFVSIFSSNLDEFFMVRAGSLFDIAAMEPNQVDNKSGLTPQQQLVGIYQMTAALVGQKEQVYGEVCRSLEVQGIADVPFSALSGREADFARGFFRDHILPVLSPQIVDSRHPTPHFGNKRLYIASLVKSKHDKPSMAFTPVPEVLPPVVMLPGSTRFIRTENLILHFASALYGNYTPVESCIFAVTRNADVRFDSDKFEDAEVDYRLHVKKLLKKRRSLAILRLELNAPVSPSFRKELLKFIPVGEHQIYTDTTPLQMGYVFGLLKLLPETTAQALSYPPHTPQWPEGLSREASMISQILQKDRCLFFPFHCVDPFIRLLNEAADDPHVVSVKITIYRLASSSKIVRALCHAAEKGKEVVVLMELRARFDEENNIAWSEMLEEAGCKVIYGMENYKCHSKICLITREKKGKFQYITQIGTGNYNEKTNAMYTDLSLMTADPEIGADATAFFQNMLVGNLEGSYRRLLVAPNGIRQTLFALIDREIAKGDRGYICIKVNSVTHRGMIDKLAEASRAGVKVRLIVRGICCIRPGIQGNTQNITVTSIVGRYLEHARIYCFGKGEEQVLYISSADLMTRNLCRRVEIACPVTDPAIRRALGYILRTQLSDTAKASLLQPDGTYLRKNGQPPVDSQAVFSQTPFPPEKPVPPAKPLGLLARLLRRKTGTA